MSTHTVRFGRLFTTPNGTYGVVYRVNGKRACTFVPKHVGARWAEATWKTNTINRELRELLFPAPKSALEAFVDSLEFDRSDIVVKVWKDRRIYVTGTWSQNRFLCGEYSYDVPLDSKRCEREFIGARTRDHYRSKFDDIIEAVREWSQAGR